MTSDQIYYTVHKAIKEGTLRREGCEICGKTDVLGHHDDYSKPLDVRWLCPAHHAQWHKENPAPLSRALLEPPSKVTMNFRITPETARRLGAAANQEGMSMTVYVELALKDRFRKDGIIAPKKEDAPE